MATFLRSSVLWVVEFRHDGRLRRWYRPAPAGTDPIAGFRQTLSDWFGAQARFISARPATPDEEHAWLRGEEPLEAWCPSGRHARTTAQAPP